MKFQSILYLCLSLSSVALAQQAKCKSEALGYPCCAPNNTQVYYQDQDGDWGYDPVKNDWCGITKVGGATKSLPSTCWSDKLGYPCCKNTCEVYFKDNDGSWGIENNDWCGIPSTCTQATNPVQPSQPSQPSQPAQPAQPSQPAQPTQPVAQTPADDFVEDHRAECPIGNVPTSVNNAKLPDPFMGLNCKRISTKAEWNCRREEIAAIFEKIMFGEKPRNPTKVEGKKSGNKYTVTVTNGGSTASFDVSINGAGTKDKPKPAIIGLDQGFGMGGSLGQATNGLDVASITFNCNNLAPENNPNSGAFAKANPGKNVGTIMAWAWGVSRLIDALEKDPDAGIDVKHLAVTGCSRLGKAALAIGAFDQRIALTIPQESGSGGASLWRVGAQVNRQKGKQFVQGLASAGTEGNWMIPSFKNYDGKENTLPIYQHMLTALVAPRALLIIDNAGQEWLGEVPSNYCGQATKEIYDALGATENYTYTQEGGHMHCSLPNGQFDEVKDFVNKFLLGKDAKTGKIDYTKNTQPINFSKAEWIDWTTPNLS